MSFYNSPRRLFIQTLPILTVFLVLFVPRGTAQVKSRTSFFLYDSKESPVDNRKVLVAASPILKLIDQAARTSPLAFVWQLNADTLVKSGDIFRELIEFDGADATFRKAMVIDTVTLKKSSKADYDVKQNFYTFSTSLATYDISQQKGKPILIFLNPATKDQQYFKVFLDKAGKNILKIQSLSTKRIYLPTAFEGPMISL
ncbi:hypothetical protein [Pedobacter gandavensis]|uniref:Uncharacterized protein n=1 Tax=Pedobacter gandavensis TaxID=2679963 RepID=A0ABR6EQK8_9SPHI|nr:hypothetical protein [Pedobacter gandavensis]MBB2147512.1 hypothetical protein [Pedobacter gandavensis]